MMIFNKKNLFVKREDYDKLEERVVALEHSYKALLERFNNLQNYCNDVNNGINAIFNQENSKKETNDGELNEKDRNTMKNEQDKMTQGMTSVYSWGDE